MGQILRSYQFQADMNIEEEIEQYIQENQPQIDYSQLQKHHFPETQQNLSYSSCVIKRQEVRSAPFQFRDKGNKLKLLSKPSNDTSHNNQRRVVLHRKMTFEGSPTKNTNDFKNENKKSTASGYRTIYSSKKQSSPMISISPDGAMKFQRQSQSPTRKNLYWQSWLLQPKSQKFSMQSSGLISKTLRIDRQPLPSISASAFIAITSDDHETLAQRNQNEKRQIASLTKIMTAYTVISLCNCYNIKVREEKITIMQQASYMQGTSANLKADEQLYIIDLLYGLMLPSGNDAGVALATFFGKFLSFKFAQDGNSNDRYNSGLEKFKTFKEYYDKCYQRQSIRLFVFQMNKNSELIGLKNTHFANPTGLSNSTNYSTARDIALLTSHCLKNHLMRDIFRKKTYTCLVTNQKMGYTRQIQWKNTNKHLYEFRECIGAKTGITPTAGPCLSSVYRVMNRQFVIVILNCSSVDQRYEDARSIYRWCRKNMKVR